MYVEGIHGNKVYMLDICVDRFLCLFMMFNGIQKQQQPTDQPHKENQNKQNAKQYIVIHKVTTSKKRIYKGRKIQKVLKVMYRYRLLLVHK